MTLSRILVVEDHPLLRSGLRLLIERNPALQSVGEATDLASARALCRELKPELILLDLHLPDGNGLPLVREVLSQAPATRVFVLSSDCTPPTVTAAFDAGIHGYVLKSAPLGEIEQALRALSEGLAFLSPQVVGIALRKLRNEPDETPPTVLSPREREMLRGLALGLRTKEVADQMGIQIKTAETFRRRLMKKLDVTSVADLTRYAIRQGIINA